MGREVIMRFGYIKGMGQTAPTPFHLPIESHPHLLLTGGSGSGKSYALFNIISDVVLSENNLKLYLADFKNSSDFRYLEGYPFYYHGDSAYEGIMQYYESFTKARQNGNNTKRHILIIDEYPSLISYMTLKDKTDKTKKANDILSAIGEILMQGRGLNFGIWLTTQRADASLFANGSRDNFHVIIALGNLSKEQKSMLFSDIEIPSKIYQQGEGIILANGFGVKEIIFPYMKNLPEWKRNIRKILLKKSS